MANNKKSKMYVRMFLLKCPKCGNYLDVPLPNMVVEEIIPNGTIACFACNQLLKVRVELPDRAAQQRTGADGAGAKPDPRPVPPRGRKELLA